jgi:thioredoxin 1
MALFGKKSKPISLEHPDQVAELLSTGKPVLIDFFQYGCRPCQVMDGIVTELAGEFGESAIVVKANAAHVPALFERYKVKSTPTFLVLTQRPGANAPTQRFRASGLVKKDVLAKTLVSGGAVSSTR